jgi:hypothetical protein
MPFWELGPPDTFMIFASGDAVTLAKTGAKSLTNRRITVAFGSATRGVNVFCSIPRELDQIQLRRPIRPRDGRFFVLPTLDPECLQTFRVRVECRVDGDFDPEHLAEELGALLDVGDGDSGVQAADERARRIGCLPNELRRQHVRLHELNQEAVSVVEHDRTARPGVLQPR